MPTRRPCNLSKELLCPYRQCREDCGFRPEEIARRKQQIREQVERGETPHVSIQKRDPAEL